MLPTLWKNTASGKKSDAYQSEAALEKEFIRLLTTQGYEYLSIHNEATLVSNLRLQLEKLNNYHFSDKEWKSFLVTVLLMPMKAL